MLAASWICDVPSGRSSDGLFLEELIRAIAEGKKDSLPETVLAMLQARLSRLDSGSRRVARVASIFGSSFWRGGVASLLGQEESAPEIAESLEVLASSEFIRHQRTSRFPNQEEYSFRHALMRDAAYSLLTDEDRTVGHALAGRYLEAQGETDAGVLAEHYRKGEQHERAVSFYIQAAQQSVDSNDLGAALERAELGIACHAQGEALGRLLAIQCAVHMWRDEWNRAYPLGSEALKWLAPGTRDWTKLIANLFVVTSIVAERRVHFQELVGQFCTVEPLPDARSAYVEAMSWLGIAFSSMAFRNEASAFLARMRQVAEPIAQSDAIARAWMHFGQTSFARMLGRDPWQNLQLASAAASAYEEAGDRRNYAHAASYVGLAQLELGDLKGAETTLRASLELAGRLHEQLQAACATVYLSAVLVRRGDESSLREAAAIARAAAEEPNANFFFAAIGYGTLSRALLKLGQLEEADTAAQKACAMLAGFPTVRQYAEATQVSIYLQTGRIAQARELAQTAVAHADANGGYDELAIRLALVNAYEAAGDTEAAHAALAAALAAVEQRAQAVPAGAARDQFMSQVEEVAAITSRRAAAH